MKTLIFSLLSFVIVTASVTYAEDIDIFECSTAVKPNVLFLFDTSASMRKQDVYPPSIPEYDHERTTWGSYTSSDPYGLVYKEEPTDLLWKDFGGLNAWTKDHYDDIPAPDFESCSAADPDDDPDAFCCTAKDEIRVSGYYSGKFSQFTATCSNSIFITQKIVATRNYITYLEFVDNEIKKLTWIEYTPNSDITTPESYERDLKTYNANRDYYNFYGPGLGFGDEPNRYRAFKYDGISVLKFNVQDHDTRKIGCDETRNALLKNGWSYSNVRETLWANCSISVKYRLVTGNFLNYLDMKFSRRYNGILAMNEVLRLKYDGTELAGRFGLMQFDLGYDVKFFGATAWENDASDLSVPCGASTQNYNTFVENLFRHYSYDESKPEYGRPLCFGDWKGDAKGTPLAESLIEAGLYFAGQGSWFNDYNFASGFFKSSSTDWADGHEPANGSTYSYQSPIQCPTQENHIILITDGSPSYDFFCHKNLGGNSDIRTRDFAHFDDTKDALSTIGNFDEDGNDTGLFKYMKMDWADDVAKFLNIKDLSPFPGLQNLKVHVIAFRMDADAKSVDRQVMEDMARNGNTVQMEVVDNKDELVEAINTALAGILEPGTFTSAVTPVRQDDMVYAGENTFLSSFHIKAGERGNGNIKKYENSTGRPQAQNYLDKVDAFPYIPLFVDGSVNPNARDLFWMLGNDGKISDPTPYEGIAYKLKTDIDTAAGSLSNAPSDDEILTALSDSDSGGRNIYTSYLDGDDWVTDSVKTLATNNEEDIVVNDAHGNPMSDTDLKELLAYHVYGYGLNWPLGDIVHSNLTPFTKKDATGNLINRLYVGANDGMLHCFDQETGKEEWAFIPPDILKDKLYLLGHSSHKWYVDGAIEILTDRYSIGGGQYLLFGERRGGTAFHILNISGNTPIYKGQINGADRGQSWGIPDLCIYNAGANNFRYGAAIGGGYDDRYDDRFFNPVTTPPTPAVKGSFISIFDVIDGNYVNEKLGDNIIHHSVVDVRMSDLNHTRHWPNNDKTKKSYRVFEQIFAGDMGGYVYNFYLQNDLATSWQGTERAVFKCADATVTTPDPTNPDATITRTVRPKIFHAPVMGGPEVDYMLFFGTGDRENPRMIEENHFYGVNGLLAGAPASTIEENRLQVYNIPPVSTSCSVCDHIPDNVTPPTPDEGTTQPRDKGWMINLPYPGEKVVSKPITLGNIVIFGTNAPDTSVSPSNGAGSCSKVGCKPGDGRIYVIGGITDTSIEYVKSKATGKSDPMPQPELLFDADSNKVLVTSGDGTTFDIDISVISGEFWRHNTDQ